jgi:regulator of protease activity HflC (stomatin/prohibitin superfamily)
MEVQMMQPPQAPKAPLLRFLCWILKPFGFVWIPEQHLQVIYRWGRYAGVREPNWLGFIHYSGLIEALGPQVYTGGQFKKYVFTGILSQDILPVTIHMTAIVGYDPRIGLPEVARVLTSRPRELIGNIAETYLRWSLSVLANRFIGTELAHRDVITEIEEEVKKIATKEMEFLGIQVRGKKVQITNVELPKSVAESQETLARQRESVQFWKQYSSADRIRALVEEAIKQLGESGAPDTFLDFSKMLEAYAAERDAGSLPAQVIDVTLKTPPPQATPPQSDSRKPPSRKSRFPRQDT